MHRRHRNPQQGTGDENDENGHGGRGRQRKGGRGSKAKEGNSFAAGIIGCLALICVLTYMRRHYVKSRQEDPFGGAMVVPTKKSLLSAEEDAALEFDMANENARYHVIFSTDCSAYQHWQSYLVYYTAMKVKQTGHVTRIASGCNEDEEVAMRAWFAEDVQFMSRRFHLHLTPRFSGVKNDKGDVVGDYKFFNKPFGLKYWLEHSPQLQWKQDTGFAASVEQDIVILIDPDMAILRPITKDFSVERETVIGQRRKDHRIAEKVEVGKPFAQTYGFGVQWSRLDLAKIAGADSPAIKVDKEDGNLYYPVGPPYIGAVKDMYRISQKWTEFVPAVYEQYPHLLAEMFAYCIAAAHLELPHQLIDSLMISKEEAGGEGWALIDEIPAAEVCEFAVDPDPHEWAIPAVVHLCQRYAVGKDWFFSKRKIPPDLYDCQAPLWAEPPGDLAVQYSWKQAPGAKEKTDITPKTALRSSFLICYLYSLLNEAATFYKRNTCPSATGMNLEKTRNLVQVMAEQSAKKTA